jgi:hypothetical protein
MNRIVEPIGKLTIEAFTRQRARAEVGRVERQPPHRLADLEPSPHHAGWANTDIRAS